MGNRELANKLASGEITQMKIGGVAADDIVVTQAAINAVDTEVSRNSSDIIVLDNGINAVQGRLDALEDNFPTDGHFYLPGVNPHMTMYMMNGSNQAVMDILQEGMAHPLAEMAYSTTLGTFYMSLNDANTGNSLTDFVLVNDGTCQIGGETVATQEFVASKNFYRYFKMHSAATISQDTYMEVARLDVYDVPGGIVEYGLAMTYNYSTTSRSAQFRFSTDGGTNWSYWSHEVKDTTNDELFYYAYPSENAAMEDVSLIVEAKCESASDTLTVKFLNLTIERKSDY